ncbi:hypothetical protein ACFE04_019714 [Oxalis oulophora]
MTRSPNRGGITGPVELVRQGEAIHHHAGRVVVHIWQIGLHTRVKNYVCLDPPCCSRRSRYSLADRLEPGNIKKEISRCELLVLTLFPDPRVIQSARVKIDKGKSPNQVKNGFSPYRHCLLEFLPFLKYLRGGSKLLKVKASYQVYLVDPHAGEKGKTLGFTDAEKTHE